MKIHTNARALGAALAHVRRGVTARSKIAILHTVLMQVDDDGTVALTTHDLDTTHTARCFAAASGFEPGVIAVPAAKAFALIEAMPADTTITIAREGDVATVSAGRSRYRVPTLPVDDFPNPLTVGASAPTASVALTANDAAALLVAPVTMVSDDTHRMHLCGVHLHRFGAQHLLAAAATDGLMMLRRVSSIAASSWPDITIPTAAVAEIARMAKRGDVTLRSDGRLVEARAEGLSFTTKLIGEAFPDYARLIPAPGAAQAIFDVAEMLAALARLRAASSSQLAPVAGLTWGAGGALTLCLAHEDGAAIDTIAATTSGASRTACAVRSLTTAIEATGAGWLCLSVEERPGAVVRLDAPEDEGIVAIVAPMYWRGATAVAA
jgi:DNA polymerase III subunit beta